VLFLECFKLFFGTIFAVLFNKTKTITYQHVHILEEVLQKVFLAHQIISTYTTSLDVLFRWKKLFINANELHTRVMLSWKKTFSTNAIRFVKRQKKFFKNQTFNKKVNQRNIVGNLIHGRELLKLFTNEHEFRKKNVEVYHFFCCDSFINE